MAGGGYYPTMMDCEWRNAPWNQDEPTYVTCVFCEGDGGWWHDGNGNIYAESEYKSLSEDIQDTLEFEMCKYCNGEGHVEYDDNDY